MNLWPGSLAGRIAIAVVAAAAALWGLHTFVTAADERALPPLREPVREPAAVAPALPDLAAVSVPILLATRAEAIPPDAAPVIDVLAGGGAFVRRPAAAAAPTAAILLPAPSLGALSPAERGALLDLLGSLVEARPVPADRVRLADVAASPREVEALLAWVP